MEKIGLPRVVIAGTSSGVGKTTVVTGLLAALKDQGYKIQSYKVGPDYIDPGYHQLASGRPAHNLDTWLVPEEKLASIFAGSAADSDIAVIEGVMGLFDGGRQGISSTAAVAKLLKAPVILVIDARSMGESAAAIALGFATYDPEVQIAGVIVNRLGSDTHRDMVVHAIEKLGIPVIGAIRRNPGLAMPERHLGLTPVTENDAVDTVALMRRQIEGCVSLDKLIEVARSAPVLELPEQRAVLAGKDRVKIGVAQDAAFSFYYPESIQVLAEAGAELVPFSPLNDLELPKVDGLILGGGFPEMFVRQLEQNKTMRQHIYSACSEGMPVYAECGGMMYLSKAITDFNGSSFEMAGFIPAVFTMQQQLETVGYVEVTALADNVLCLAGEKLKGHEFHFSSMQPLEPGTFPWAFQFTKVRTGAVYPGGYTGKRVLASYLHTHFAGSRRAAERFVALCRQFQELRQAGR